MALPPLVPFSRMAYWMGPWAPSGRLPPGVVSRPVDVDPKAERPSRLYVPTDLPPRGAWLLSPGMHHLGPEDPRMDRLARILARSGFVVLSPALHELLELRITANLMPAFRRAFEVLESAPETPKGCRPAIFSVSAGSYTALRLASEAAFAERVGAVVSFGGYADIWDVFREHCDEEAPFGSEMNPPKSFLCVWANHLDPPFPTEALCAGWRRYLIEFAERDELKIANRQHRSDLADEIAASLPEGQRRIFRVGCGLEPGAYELCKGAEATPELFDALSPRSFLGGLRCPVHLIHSETDSVIKVTHLDQLAAAIPAGVEKQIYRLAAYDHSATLTGGLLSGAAALAREAATMFRVLRTASRGGTP